MSIMNRRDLFKGLSLAAVAVLVNEKIDNDGVALSAVPHPGTTNRGPYNTDDAYYDELLDEMMGEEWS